MALLNYFSLPIFFPPKFQTFRSSKTMALLNYFSLPIFFPPKFQTFRSSKTMALLSRLRSIQVQIRLSSIQVRHLSSILKPDSKTPLSGKDKSRAALNLVKSEKNPERILYICRAASLNPAIRLDRLVFSVAITKLTESNYFEGIRLFIEELKTRPDLRNENTICHAMILYGQAGLIDSAIKTFEQLPKLGFDRTTKSLNALVFSCIVGKKYNEVNRIFLEFPKKYGIEPDRDTYNTVIRGFCESGSSNSVYSMLDEMKRKRIKPNMTTFGTIITGFYTEEKLDDVRKALELMKKLKIHPWISIYNIRIKYLCKLKKCDEAMALFDGMISRGMQPNTVTYYHMIFGFCKEGRLDEAMKLFDEMIEGKLKPLSNCYFTLVYFLCQKEDFETALRISNESMMKGWFPNFSTMKMLVDGLMTISKVEEAKELIRQVKEKFPKRANLWEQVEEEFSKIQ